MIGDAIMGLLLLNDVRHRVLTRVFGVSREQSNVMTVVAVGLVSEGLHSRAAKVRGARPHLSIADSAIGAMSLKEAAHGVAGPWSRSVPFFGALIAFAALARSFGPMVRGSFHGARQAVRGAGTWTRRVLTFLGGQ
jgi:hypothetical protein